MRAEARGLGGVSALFNADEISAGAGDIMNLNGPPDQFSSNHRFGDVHMEASEKCGVVGVYGVRDAAVKAYYSLFALQHRGQESAGLVASDGAQVRSKKGLGLVGDAFSEDDLRALPGHLAAGHVRYSTTGAERVQNIQPLVVEYSRALVVVAHNGNLVNARTLRGELAEQGAIFQTSTDSELIVHLMARSRIADVKECLTESLKELRGAFSFVIMTKDEVFAVRDPQGFRPLCLGTLDGGWTAASETCALDLIGAEFVREVEPGEVVCMGPEGLSSWRFAGEKERRAHCIFEHVYFARPDSYIFGDNVHMVRVRLGRNLAREHPADADVVIPVPDSGNSAALGYSLESGIPLDFGIIRNHYIGRTFIMPGRSERAKDVRIKLNAVKQAVKGKRVVLVEDSIIRATTLRARLGMVKAAGAKEIHIRISCPPVRSPCYYGIDFPTKKELIAANRTVEEIREYLGADSLGYLSVKGLLDAVSGAPQDYCVACYTGDYPVECEEGMEDKMALESRVAR